MDDPSPPSTKADGRAPRELMLRVASAAVLAPLAIGVTYVGGWAFVAFWTIAACAILWEWRRIIAGHGRVTQGLGECMLAIAAATAMVGPAAGIALSLAVGAAIETFVARPDHHRAWAAAGVLYAGALVIPCVLLRNDANFGLTAIMLLFAIVWSTDILAYFVGRLVGGPKLWTRVSPNKTWSGAIGGALGAMVAALGVAHYASLSNPLAVAATALVLSAVSQAGDLFESAFKRRFGVKDAGHLIPGHGGIMDRLDGFLAAAAVAVVIGILRGGLDAPASGLLMW